MSNKAKEDDGSITATDTTTNGDNSPVVDDSMVRAQQRCAEDGTYTPISWIELVSLIRANDLAALTRSPADLVGYYKWKCETVREYGSVETFLLKERLGWWKANEEKDDRVHHENGGGNGDYRNGGEEKGGRGRADTKPVSCVPFECDEDWKLLRNDFPYGVEKGIEHVVVWMKNTLAKNSREAQTQQQVQDGRGGAPGVDARADADAEAGVLTSAAKETLEKFLYGRLFKHVKRDDILYFLNPPSLKVRYPFPSPFLVFPTLSPSDIGSPYRDEH